MASPHDLHGEAQLPDLARRLEEWRRLLLDTSKRSRLIKSTFGRGGVLGVEHPEFFGLWDGLAIKSATYEFPWPSDCLGQEEAAEGSLPDGEARDGLGTLTASELQNIKESGALAQGSLLTNLRDRSLESRLKRLALNASTSLSEQGVNSLFLAFGFLRWFESADSDEAVLSPLVLMPASLNKESADSKWKLAPIDDDLVCNHALSELLRADFRLELPPFPEEELWESAEAIRTYFANVEGAISKHQRWQVQTTAALGTFGFQKISMWHDLRKNEEQIKNHPLCRGIAGDSSLMPQRGSSDLSIDDLDDNVLPETSYLVRDCDASQLAAIEIVHQGHNLILDGPPGTGKSQTITNIISRCLANKKTVLFVSEKAAALEVVKRRLDEADLGDFCLECHSHKANKRIVVEELGRCLDRGEEIYPSQDQKIFELRRTRQRLNDYVRALHLKMSALNITAYAVHGMLSKVISQPASRLHIPDMHRVEEYRLQEMEEAVARLSAHASTIASHGIHPWRGFRTELFNLSSAKDAEFHFSRAIGGLRALLSASAILISGGFLGSSPTIKELLAAVESDALVVSYPEIPLKWVDAGILSCAKKYVSLDELSLNFRILNSSTTVFKDDAFETANPRFAVAARESGTRLSEMLPELPPTVRRRIAYIDECKNQMECTVDLLREFEGKVRALSHLLGLGDSSALTVASGEELAAKVLALAGIGPANLQWFDSAQRHRLRKIGANCKQFAEMANTLFTVLEQRFRAAALTPVARDDIDDVLRHQSWLQRFGSSWRRAKQAFTTLYKSPTSAKTRQLLDDAFQLRRFQGYMAKLTETVGDDCDALQWDGSLAFDLESLNARFDIFDLLPMEWQNAEGVQKFATSADLARRHEIASAAQKIRDLSEQLSLSIAALREAGAMSEIPKNIDQVAIGIVQNRMEDLLKRVAEHRIDLITLAAFIDDEHDVPVDIEREFETLAELRAARAKAKAIADSLEEELPPVGARSLGDWKAQSDLAAWVISFVKAQEGEPPQHIVRVISSPEFRARLSATVKEMRSIYDPAVRESLRFLASLFDSTAEISNGIVLDRATISELIEWMTLRIRDGERISEWVSFVKACDNLRKLGMESLLDEVISLKIPVEKALGAFRSRFYQLWLIEAYRREKALADFDLAQHEQTVSQFREADRYLVKNGYATVRSKILQDASRGPRNDDSAPAQSELGILLREVNKRRRHLPLRRLFSQIPSLLLKLKPCLMMSPLAVSTYFGDSEIRFDAVIFDEASQVRPHDAICAIYRGSQLIVAGDQKQLPPSNFFERAANDDEDGENELDHRADDFESILDMSATLGLPRQRLKWHYRSKRESLIAFSNRHFYGGELVTFPSVEDVDGSSGIKLHVVSEGRWAGGSSGGVNHREAEKIADAVVRHASDSPDKSLGVITMNQAQQLLVLELIDSRRKQSIELEGFFSSDRTDPFFVKNLENVQGDERDVIFLGIGYAKNDTGTLSHNFGPLNRQGGERRLNVAITRARESLSVFTSIRAEDIDLSRTQARGAKLLRAYLDFAERGRIALFSSESEAGEKDFDSDFEREVARALADRNLIVQRQIGCSGYRIDLAIVHPSHPGRYVLGVECDGATYHSSANARDRDRLRQEILEGLGWKICRIWSTDWIRNPLPQIAKVIEAYQKALVVEDLPPPSANPETILSAEPPQPCQPSAPRNLHFEKIEDVSALLLRNALIDSVNAFGAMPTKDLTQATAKKLGFGRVGKRIRHRIEREINELKREGKLALGSDEKLGFPLE